jgi:formylglycine-generating enzyme required for sulfatase activity
VKQWLLLPAISVLFCLYLTSFPSIADAGGIQLPAGIIKSGGQYVCQKDGMPMVMVPGGEFMMGSAGGSYDETPSHKVRLTAFLIDRHEVTNAQFERFLKASSYKVQGPWRRGYGANQGEFPCRYVTWFDAKAYADWAGRQLPSEAQWEMAARGTKNFTFPWGMQWQEGLSCSAMDVSAGPRKVGSFPKGASPYGCLDMAGNVWEWVNDWYDRYYYQSFKAVADNPTGPPDGAQPEGRFLKSKTASGNERSTLKVIRGGGWAGTADDARSSRRMWGNPSYWLDDTGFRLAVKLERRP